MSNRYVTETEKEGARRRSREHQQRLRDAGFNPKQHWLTEPENEKIKKIIKHWRGEESWLSEEEASAASVLKPK